MFWEELLYILEKLLHKIAAIILQVYLPLVFCFRFGLVFLCIPVATTLDPSSSFQPVSLPLFAPVYGAAWFMIVTHGCSEGFSSLCKQTQSPAEHLRPSVKTWVQTLLPHLGAWTHCPFSFFFFFFNLFKLYFPSSLKWGWYYLTDSGCWRVRGDLCKISSVCLSRPQLT